MSSALACPDGQLLTIYSFVSPDPKKSIADEMTNFKRKLGEIYHRKGSKSKAEARSLIESCHYQLSWNKVESSSWQSIRKDFESESRYLEARIFALWQINAVKARDIVNGHSKAIDLC